MIDALSFFIKFNFNLLHAPIEGLDLSLHGAALLSCTLPVLLPDFQPQDAGENAFAVPWPLLGKLIGFALQEERSVDEGLVVKAQRFRDACFSIAQCTFCERLPAPGLPVESILRIITEDMEFQCGSFVAGFGAQNPEDITFVAEDEADFSQVLFGINQGIIALACLSKEGPGDCIQQRGFAGAI